MKFIPAFNIWETSSEELSKAQPGQWVYAGERKNKGVFLGVRSTGSLVVAWYSIPNNQRNFRAHIRALRTHAKG